MKSIRSSMLGVALATAGLLAAVPAFAGTTTGSFPVNAAVTAACVINSAQGIAFGNYDPITNKAAPLDGAGTINVTCTKGANVSVALDQGVTAATGSTCDAPSRNMLSGTSDKMAYAIYSDSGHTKAWGCGTSNKVSFTSVSGTSPYQLNTYGRVAAGQDLPTGAYADTVTATVAF